MSEPPPTWTTLMISRGSGGDEQDGPQAAEQPACHPMTHGPGPLVARRPDTDQRVGAGGR